MTLTVNLSQAVSVAGGTPTLTLNDGGTATYTGGSGSNTLNLSYTVAAGQSTPALAVTAVNLMARPDQQHSHYCDGQYCDGWQRWLVDRWQWPRLVF